MSIKHRMVNQPPHGQFLGAARASLNTHSDRRTTLRATVQGRT